MRHQPIPKNRNILFVAVMSALALASLPVHAQDLVLDGTDTQTINTTQDLGSGQIVVGKTSGSHAVLTIESGGSLSSAVDAFIGQQAGAGGAVTVNGTGSLNIGVGGGLFVGDDGTGSLAVENGGTVNLSHIMIARHGNGTVIVTGAGSSLTTTDLIMNGTGTGALSILSGATVNSDDGALGGSSTTLISGSGSTWTVDGGSSVGDGVGTSVLTLADGGRMRTNGFDIASFAGSTGTVSVTGVDSTLTSSGDLLVAGSGTGSLTIADGGTVNATGTVTIARDSGSTGTLNIGAAAGDAAAAAGTLHAGAVQFGYNGGTLNFNHTDTAYAFSADMSGAGIIQQIAGTTDLTGDSSGFSGHLQVDGGTLNVMGQLGANNSTIGRNTGSSGTVNVSGTGADWANSIGINIGYSGNGTLTVSNGGSVSDAYAFIAFETGSTGAVTVTGAGSTWETTGFGEVHVGDVGDGTLTISNGGLVSLTSSLSIADKASSTSTLNIGAAAGETAVAAGTLDTNSVHFGAGTGSVVFNHTDADYHFDAAISGAGTLDQMAGFTDLTGGSSGFTGTTHVTGGTLKVNGTLGGTVDVTGGTLGGSGTLSGNVSVTDGAIAPGNSPGTLTIGGDLALAAGSSLDFQLGSPSGTAGTDSDLIDVGGNLTLDGTLNVANAGGFGTGLYRLINYDGTLTDNGLDIGAGPAGFNSTNLTVQTATAGQVNLLVGASLISFSFWDGANTGANDAVDGGAATWTANATNWTVADGSVNGAFDPAALLIFAGTPGTVTVDDGAGAVALRNGMQFAVDGYTVSGDAVGLTGANVIRVGDGTAAGAGYTATIAAPLTGTGSLEKTDLGTLVLTGANTYAGGTTVSAGTLVGDTTSLQGNIADQAALRFDQTTKGTYAGAISGTGTLTKSGAGALVLTGDSSTYAGTTDIAAGLLAVNGSLGGTIHSSGGTLGGSGMLGDVTIASGGTLAPGNSIGTLNVASVALDAGSTYAVQLDDGGFVAGTDNDVLNVSGKASIDGGTVHVTPENGTDDGTTYTPGTYTILTAAGGVSGTFDAVIDDYAFLDFALGYDAKHVFLTSSLASTGFCLTGMSTNQCAAGNAAFSQGAGHGVFDAVLTLSGAEAPAALDRLSGEIHASAKTALLQDGRFAREAALGRLRSAQDATDPGTGQVIRQTSHGTFWTQGFGAWSRWNGDGNAATAKRHTGGLFVGGDTRVAGDVLLGVMVGYSRSSINADDRASSATVTSHTLGAYVSDAWGKVSVKGGVAQSWHRLDTSRSVAFTGFADSLHADYKARSFQTYTEAAYGIAYGKARFEPFANLAYETLDTDGFHEHGGAAALTAAGQTSHATFGTLGIRSDTPFAFGKTAARLSASLGWRHAFGDTPTATQRFAAGGSAFAVDGVPLARNVLAVDAGFELDLTERTTLSLAYDGQFGSGVSDHGARLGLSIDL